MLKLNRTQQLLCAAVADRSTVERVAAATELCTIAGDEAAFAFAHENEVAAAVAHALAAAHSNDTRWREAHSESCRRITAYLAELDRIATLLGNAGIPLVALKNAGIARGIYPCPGCCPMGDLDVLVQKRHFRTAHTILLEAGYHFQFRSAIEKAEIGVAEQGGGTEYWIQLTNGDTLWLELQWRPVAGRWIRPDQEPSAEALMANSIPIEGTAVRLLAPADNLLQVALHTAKHSYIRAPGFRLHTDVDRIIRRQPIDWDHFLAQTLHLQVRTPVYFSLLIPKLLFGTPVPLEVLTQLRPAAWKQHAVLRWIQRAGLYGPLARKFSKPGYVCFTALLYDDMRGLLRAVFPDRSWMRQRYGFHNDLLLPLYHARRVIDLLFRRHAL